MVVSRKKGEKKGMDGVGMICIRCGSKKNVHFRESMQYVCDECIEKPYKASSFRIVTMVGLFISLSNYGGLL